ncbi:MAG: hypothetical protein KC621_13500 [Myxococcales bacterium]|nr:hypothetical protein [Myxococcales bacterium]
MARWRKIAAGTGGCGCLGLVAGGVGGVLLAAVITGVVVTVAAQWEAALRSALDSGTGGEVTFDHLGLSWSGVVVHGVVVTAEDGRPVLTADKIKVGVRRLDTLRTERWTLSSLDLQGVDLQLRRHGEGWAMPRQTLAWLEDDAPTAIPLPTVEVPTVRVRDAKLSVPLEAKGPPLLLGADELHIEDVVATPENGGVTLAFGQIKGRDGSVSGEGFSAVAGTLAATSPGPWTLQGGWALATLAAADARVEAGKVRATVKGLAAAGFDVATLDLGAAEATGVEAKLAGDTVRIEKIALDPDPGAPVLTVPSVAVTGVTGSLADWAGLGAGMRSWGKVRGTGVERVEVATLTIDRARVGGTSLSDVEVSALRASPAQVAFDGLAATSATVGPVTVSSLRIDALAVGPSKTLRLPPTRASGGSIDVDLYAPHLGLSGLVGALPAGTSFERLTLEDTKVAVKAGKRSADATVGSVSSDDVVSSGSGWTVASASFSGVDGTLRSSSGALSTHVGSGRVHGIAFAERTTVAGGTLSGVSASEGGRGRVASASGVELGDDGVLTVSGGEAWTALTGPHELAIPPVLTEHVPAGLGGSAKGAASWWDIALSDLPWVPKRIGGSGTLHLKDEAIARKTWDIVAERFTMGPFGGDTAPVSVNGTMAGGTFQANGQATSAGKVTLAVKARGLDAKEFEPYGTPLLAKSGLGVGPGRVAMDADVKLDRKRLILDGQVAVKNLTLVIADRKKVGAVFLGTFKGGKFTIDDSQVPILASCALDAPACSPIDEIVATVTRSLMDSASHGITEPAAGVADGVKDVLGNFGIGGKKNKKK